MQPGDIVLLLDEAVVDLQLRDNRRHIGILIVSEDWTMDAENNVSSTMWKVLVDSKVHVLNEFSLAPLNIQYNSL